MNAHETGVLLKLTLAQRLSTIMDNAGTASSSIIVTEVENSLTSLIMGL